MIENCSLCFIHLVNVGIRLPSDPAEIGPEISHKTSVKADYFAGEEGSQARDMKVSPHMSQKLKIRGISVTTLH